MAKKDVILRILDLLEDVDDNDCWLFGGVISKWGYAQVSDSNHTPRVAHKLLYETLVGDVPEGYEVDHLCRVRRCVNPSHLEAVTKSENIRRSTVRDRLAEYYTRQRALTQCKHGHPYNEKNTYYRKSNINQRTCRVCRNLSQRKYIKRIKALKEVRHA